MQKTLKVNKSAASFLNNYRNQINLDTIDWTESPVVESLVGFHRKQLISVIIPTYNRFAMLEKAIDSVLMQSYPYIEIIVVDDASVDGTSDVIKTKYKDQVIVLRNETNQHAGRSRQRGYLAANGKYVVFLDDDDYYIDNSFFANAILLFMQNQNLSCVGSNSFILRLKDHSITNNLLNTTGEISGIEYLSGFQTIYSKPNSTFTTVFRKEKLDEVEFGNMQMMNDSSIYMRALLKGDAHLMSDIVGVYSVHESNLTKKLDVSFLISNLEEKYKIYQWCLANDIPWIDMDWFSGQTVFTIRYFLNSNKAGWNEYKSLYSWMKLKKIPYDYRANLCLLFAKHIANRLRA